jgi:anti-sigma factor RsiW
MRRTGDDDGHVQVLLGAFLLGGLTADEESAVRAHLSVCARCRAEHDHLACVPGWLDLMKENADHDDPANGGAAAGRTRHLRVVQSRPPSEPGAESGA